MLFSVIVPIYNVEQYLEQCVNSILSQSFDDFELILVDDGSPDRCPQICDALAKTDSRIVVIHKVNGGLSDARNTGIRAARGTYAVFVDSDDFYASNSVLQTVADEIQKSAPDIVQFHRKWYDEETDTYVEKKDPFSVSCRDYTPDEVITQLVCKSEVYFSACQNVIKLSFLKSFDLYFKIGIKSEDIDWGFRVFSHKPKITLLQNALYVYRAGRGGSITSTKNYSHLENYCSLLERAANLIEAGDRGIYFALMSYLMYHVSICAALIYQVPLSKKEKKELQNRLAELCKNRMGRYNADSRAKWAGKLYRMFGYRVMAYALGFYLKNRSKQQHSFQTVQQQKS